MRAQQRPSPTLRTPSESNTMKCIRCERQKTSLDFAIDRSRKNGRHPWCKKCCRAYAHKRRHIYLPRKRKASTESRRRLRLEVLTHYCAGRKPFCACCKISILEFLGIDHIEGGGRKHKMLVGHLYQWLKKMRFPKGFRVLCHNCNQSLGAYRYCPHDSK